MGVAEEGFDTEVCLCIQFFGDEINRMTILIYCLIWCIAADVRDGTTNGLSVEILQKGDVLLISGSSVS